MSTSEECGQAPAPSPDDDHRSRALIAHASLDVLRALLNLEGDRDSHSDALQTLRAVFAFDRALVLEERDDGLHCATALPAAAAGHWPCGTLFQDVLHGQVMSTGAERSEDWRDVPADVIPPSQAALCLPVGIGGRRAIMVMTRADGPFSEDHVIIARQCAVVALAALAARNGDKLEAEIEQLRAQVAHLQQSQQNTQQGDRLLVEIVNHLPLGLTVQDENGRFIVVNEIAAANLGTPMEELIGASPADFLSAEDAAHRREWEVGLMQSGQMSTVEENVAAESGEQTWLTAHKPVRILDQTLLLTSSLEITERKRVENDLATRVHFDELTGFPNRVLIQRQVEDLLRRHSGAERFALAFIDLDNFKHINDYYSHAIGDALLVKIAKRIANRLRDSDMLARISGDEFLLLLHPIENDEQVRRTIANIVEDLKQPFHIEAFEMFTSASIGVSIHPDHGISYEELRRNADNAMYRAKNGTKGNAIYFDVNMGRTITARMELEQRLRLAIRDRKFCCAFQPKVDIRTQDVIGFETLVRWRDDDGEIQPPSSFVGLAVELGLIDPITQFVMTEALRSIEQLDDSFGSDTAISVNVAAKQAGDIEFMRSLVSLLKDSPHAKRVMIELTEDAFLEKGKFQAQVLPMLREIGVRVSIDDFGTGYSSLSALAEIPADELKVDRSFITSIHERPRSQSVLRAIESLGHALEMTIVAEGVETFEELAYLQAATRIRYAQGYYFSKPFFLTDAANVKRVNFEGRAAEATREHVGRRGVGGSRGG
jgi:diguanylate cyclase (GGDEF)-like protein/PAS domain S-box-containing protein